MTRGENKRIVAALKRARAGTSSRIAVRIVADKTVDAFEHAKAEFVARELHTHPGANAALILVAPQARTFAVIGDTALHERVGQAFWDDLVAQMAGVFKTAGPAEAIVLGIDHLGAVMRTHFAAPAP